MKIQFQNHLKNIKERIEKELQDIYKEIKGLTPPFVEYLSKSSGKRLRALLLYTAGKLLGADERSLIKLGAAIELIHSASLFHDDIIDEASERRGLRAAHRVFGIEEAIILGDILYIRSISIATSFDNLELIKAVAKEVEGMVAGEMDETLNLYRYDLKEEDYFRIINGKTARLFSLSCYLPAILVRDISSKVALERFGDNFGMAFQILDDIADIVMDKEKLGKPVLSDLKEGKLTLPYIYYRDGGGKYSENIKNFFENGDELDFIEVRNDLIRSDALSSAIEKMEELLEKARRSLDELEGSGKWKRVLQEATNLREIYGI